MANLTVYGIPQSTYVRTVRLLLEEAGAEYNLKAVDIFNGENKSAEVRLNPRKQVQSVTK